MIDAPIFLLSFAGFALLLLAMPQHPASGTGLAAGCHHLAIGFCAQRDSCCWRLRSPSRRSVLAMVMAWSRRSDG